MQQYFFRPHPQGQRSNMKFQLQSQFQRFLYQSLCVFSQIIDIKHIEQNFNNNNSLYFQRVTHLAKKKLIFYEALYKLQPK